MTVFVLSLAGLMLAGCTVLPPVKPASMKTYALDVKFEPAVTASGELTLLVNTPNALPGFNSSRMIYISNPHEINFFAENQWIDSPANMLEPLLVQALERSASYRAVVQLRSGVLADRSLETEIIRFQHEFLARPSQVHLTIRAQLLDVKKESVIATREFDVIEVATEDNPYGGVVATNRAVKIILQQIADFCAVETQTDKPKTYK